MKNTRQSRPNTDKGIRPELLRELAVPWRPSPTPVRPTQLAAWKCPADNGQWSLAPDLGLIWQTSNNSPVARVDITVATDSHPAPQRLGNIAPWRTTTTALGPAGWSTVFTAPGNPLEITRELLPPTLVPSASIPAGAPPLLVRITLHNRGPKPVRTTITLRTAAPSTAFHPTPETRTVRTGGAQTVRLTVPPKSSKIVAIVCGTPARAAQPLPDPHTLSSAIHHWLDDTTLPIWLVDAWTRAALAPVGERYPSARPALGTTTRPPGPGTDPMDAFPAILALRRLRPALATPNVCLAWAQRLQTSLQNETPPGTTEESLRHLLAIVSAEHLLSELPGAPAELTTALRTARVSRAQQFQSTFQTAGWPSERVGDSPCRPSDIAWLADFHALGLEPPLPPDTRRRWLETVWNHCLLPGKTPTQPAVSQAPARFSLQDSGWIRAFVPGATDPNPERETDPAVLWRVAAALLADGTPESGLVAGAIAAKTPGARVEDIQTYVAALGGWRHDPSAGTVAFQPPGNSDLIRIPFATADGFGIATQSTDSAGQRWTVEMRHGTLVVRRLTLQTARADALSGSLLVLGKSTIAARPIVDDRRLTFTPDQPMAVKPGQRLYVSILH